MTRRMSPSLWLLLLVLQPIAAVPVVATQKLDSDQHYNTYLKTTTTTTTTTQAAASTKTNSANNSLDGENKIINPYPYRFILQATPCDKTLELLVTVHSSTKGPYTRRRKLLRNTWLRPGYLENKLGLVSKVLFFMGKSANENDQKLIEYESEHYGDIVQSSFTDSYENNTYKAMSYLLWTSEYCSNASILMKIDDDILLQPKALPALREKMQSWSKLTVPFYIGKFLNNRVLRSGYPKWIVSREAWPYDTYPTWFQGLVYFLNPRSAGELYQQAMRIRYLHVDDVFIGITVNRTHSFKTGIIMKQNDISAYVNIQKYWDEGIIPFLHVPDIGLYMKWTQNLY